MLTLVAVLQEGRYDVTVVTPITSAAPQPIVGVTPHVDARSSSTYAVLDLTSYALRLGTTGFGGPVALVGYMNRDLVERRRWISEDDYKRGLTLAQLAPGPLAAQLMIYLGFVHYGIFGATVVGIAFVLPSFLMVVALGWAYSLYGGLSWMQAVFYGVGASVIGIIAHSAYKLTRKSVGTEWLLWLIYVATVAYTVVTENENIWLFLGGGVLAWLVRTPPRFLRVGQRVSALFPLPVIAVLSGVPTAATGTLWQVFWFFAKAGAFVFGSGLAIVPFLYGGVVQEHHWLTERQFVDAVAVAMITPGPVVITVGFIGFLIGGFKGAALAALGTFLPCYLFTIIPAPLMKKYGTRPGIVAFVDGVTAAAIGAISGAVIVLGRRSIYDVTTAVLAVATILLLWRVKKVPEPLVIAAAAVIGLVVYPLVRH
jgi:chromate transporter